MAVYEIKNYNNFCGLEIQKYNLTLRNVLLNQPFIYYIYAQIVLLSKVNPNIQGNCPNLEDKIEKYLKVNMISNTNTSTGYLLTFDFKWI